METVKQFVIVPVSDAGEWYISKNVVSPQELAGFSGNANGARVISVVPGGAVVALSCKPCTDPLIGKGLGSLPQGAPKNALKFPVTAEELCACVRTNL
jgi:hypothetical protein